MDTRPFRMECLTPDTHWFEVDFEHVLAYKNDVMDSLNAKPKCTRHCLTANVTEKEWTNHLSSAGFDANAPTLWILEGLIFYLKESAVRALLGDIYKNSAEGSRILVLSLPKDWVESQSTADSVWGSEGASMSFGLDEEEVGPFFASLGFVNVKVESHLSVCKKLNRKEMSEELLLMSNMTTAEKRS